MLTPEKDNSFPKKRLIYCGTREALIFHLYQSAGQTGVASIAVDIAM